MSSLLITLEAALATQANLNSLLNRAKYHKYPHFIPGLQACYDANNDILKAIAPRAYDLLGEYPGIFQAADYLRIDGDIMLNKVAGAAKEKKDGIAPAVRITYKDGNEWLYYLDMGELKQSFELWKEAVAAEAATMKQQPIAEAREVEEMETALKEICSSSIKAKK